MAHLFLRPRTYLFPFRAVYFWCTSSHHFFLMLWKFSFSFDSNTHKCPHLPLQQFTRVAVWPQAERHWDVWHWDESDRGEAHLWTDTLCIHVTLPCKLVKFTYYTQTPGTPVKSRNLRHYIREWQGLLGKNPRMSSVLMRPKVVVTFSRAMPSIVLAIPGWITIQKLPVKTPLGQLLSIATCFSLFQFRMKNVYVFMCSDFLCRTGWKVFPTLILWVYFCKKREFYFHQSKSSIYSLCIWFVFHGDTILIPC